MYLTLTQTSLALEKELEWLAKVIAVRFDLSYGNKKHHESIYEIPLPDLEGDTTYYGEFVAENQLEFDERLILILSLAPYLRPALLDPLLVKNPDTEKPFSEFGGMQSAAHNGLLPTGQTALYLLAGEDISVRQRLIYLFSEEHTFHTKDIVHLGNVPPEEPFLSGILSPSYEFASIVITGKKRRTKYTLEFPAKEVETGMVWSDLVLDDHIMNEVGEILTWLKYNETLMNDWGMTRKLKPGYRALFYGPPGTGKTLTATLLGKATGRPVYQIDLSAVVSKYIGETEKNLGRVFDAAMNKNWILFFDEADALFGKRTKVSDSHDRYANQEVSYLLQRVEDYPGLVILATNLKSNIDDAFQRRFQSMIHFTIPGPAERLKLWEACFPEKLIIGANVNLRQIATRYEISGGSIINVVQYCSLQALKRGDNTLRAEDLHESIRREFQKEGKTI
jgi:AAA+ superfamily predicted ATPase